MIHSVSNANSIHASYQPAPVTAPKQPEKPPPIDEPRDTFTPSRASDLDHDGDNH